MSWVREDVIKCYLYIVLFIDSKKFNLKKIATQVFELYLIKISLFHKTQYICT